MSFWQYVKLITKIVAVLPVVMEGIKAVIKRYREVNNTPDMDERP